MIISLHNLWGHLPHRVMWRWEIQSESSSGSTEPKESFDWRDERSFFLFQFYFWLLFLKRNQRHRYLSVSVQFYFFGFMLFNAGLVADTPGPPCRSIGPAALRVCPCACGARTRVRVCCSGALKASSSNYNTIYLENIYKGLENENLPCCCSYLLCLISHSSLFLVDLKWIFRGRDFVVFGASHLWRRKLKDSFRLRCKVWAETGSSQSWLTTEGHIYLTECSIRKCCGSFTKEIRVSKCI